MATQGIEEVTENAIRAVARDCGSLSMECSDVSGYVKGVSERIGEHLRMLDQLEEVTTRLLGDGSVRFLIANTGGVIGGGAIPIQDLGQLNPLAMARQTIGPLFDANPGAVAACDGSVVPATDATLQKTVQDVTSELLAALHFGAGGENVALLPAVRFSPDQGLARDLLFDLAEGLVSPTGPPSGTTIGVGGPAGLCELVRSSASVARRADALCKTLTNVGKASAASVYRPE